MTNQAHAEKWTPHSFGTENDELTRGSNDTWGDWEFNSKHSKKEKEI